MLLHQKLIRKIHHFSSNDAAAAAIEFAILLPLLLFLFVAMVELTTAVSYDRRVGKAGSSVADLVGRASDVSTSISDIQKAIGHQMTPYEDADVDVRVGMVLIDENLPKTVWSWGNKDSTPWGQGSKPDGVEFAPSMLTNGQYHLVSTATLDYTPILGKLMSNLSERLTGDKGNFLSIPLGDSFILQPRRVACVEYRNNCANYSPE